MQVSALTAGARLGPVVNGAVMPATPGRVANGSTGAAPTCASGVLRLP